MSANLLLGLTLRRARDRFVWFLWITVSVAPFGSLCPGADVRAAADALVAAVNQGNAAEVDRQLAEVTKLGKAAAPELREAIRGAEGEGAFVLVVALGRIPGAESTVALWDLALTHPDKLLQKRALAVLDNRILPEQEQGEVERAVSALSTVEGEVAAGISGTLLRSQLVKTERQAGLIIMRFLEAAQSYRPGSARGTPIGSYLDPSIRSANEYVRPLYTASNPVYLAALKKALTSEQDATRRLWLNIAIGTCGDAEPAKNLESAVRSSALDASVRALALRALAKALGREAKSILEAFVEDSTLGPDGVQRPLAVVAKNELRRMNKL